MDNNNTNFYLSGLLSLGLFTLFFILGAMTLFSPSKINTFALKKDNFISISLEIPKEKNVQAKREEPTSSISEPVVTPKKNIDINNLFSDVWTKKITPKKEVLKQHNNKRLLDIQKKIKRSEVNDIKSISDKVNNLDNVKTHNDTSASSTAQEVNEYLAKIQAIVYQYFHVPANSQGSSVKTVIELNSLGKVLDFRVLNYSNNAALNAEADKIKKRLKHIIFPKNPHNSSSRTIVILISKE